MTGDLFGYVNVLDKTADASWLRNEAINNNIANQDTPNYTRQDVEFEDILQRELQNSRYTTVDRKVENADLSHLTARTYKDNTGTTYRIDGNNVDPDTEEVELASNQLKYQGLITSIDSEFTQMKAVLK
jgi:flagellar basal-body rod protein FlgB